jgi:hypothetical protein
MEPGKSYAAGRPLNDGWLLAIRLSRPVLLLAFVTRLEQGLCNPYGLDVAIEFLLCGACLLMQ